MFKAFMMLNLAALLVLGACSDDTDPGADTGVDTGQQETGTPDKGPGTDGVTADKSTADAPAKKKVEEYIPTGTEVTGWKADSTKKMESGYDKTTIDLIINGSNDPYDTEGEEGFARNYFVRDFSAKCKFEMEFQIWEMTKVASGKKMLEYNKKKQETDAGLTFTDISGVMDKAIIADNTPYWEVYIYKAQYMIKFTVTWGDTSCKANAKTDAEKWAAEAVKLLP